jgi:hypothetical protein
MNDQAKSEKSGDMQTDLSQGNGDPGDQMLPLDPKIQDLIGRSLKAHYDDLINAPIPDKFLSLLAELEAKEQKRDN